MLSPGAKSGNKFDFIKMCGNTVTSHYVCAIMKKACNNEKCVKNIEECVPKYKNIVAKVHRNVFNLESECDSIYP